MPRCQDVQESERSALAIRTSVEPDTFRKSLFDVFFWVEIVFVVWLRIYRSHRAFDPVAEPSAWRSHDVSGVEALGGRVKGFQKDVRCQCRVRRSCSPPLARRCKL